jgi:hypothetical protein
MEERGEKSGLSLPACAEEEHGRGIAGKPEKV